ncbi:EF-P lysine aminoacylase EpmA [Muricoccus pecuniae]|uniref:Lysyl-tRNA synthetase class 2 n=1 Tax=Muricoccus pecuniae TaxID=693023 RepID=A0A840YF60_9PROT|nr:EF-P lysine aminoacylase EpmA [Roseomonas pecuniae]MBB5694861.1 lysyl-tRNA synthetase class 2 [Roseomonas pecuniae]
MPHDPPPPALPPAAAGAPSPPAPSAAPPSPTSPSPASPRTTLLRTAPPPWHPDALAARLPALRRRAALLRDTRAFWEGRGCTEVETPALVPVPGMEVHLHGFRSRFEPHLGRGEGRDLWLRTSPELAIKRLLVGGAGSVFEIARVWRNGEVSARHAPEFTMLEVYLAGAGMEGLMEAVEDYLRAVLPRRVLHTGVETDLSLPFERVSVAGAFARLGLDLLASVDPRTGEGDAAALAGLAREAGLAAPEGLGWEDLFFHLMLEHVEPRLGRERATFLTHWPAPQAALARRDPADPRAALRFEVFAAGLELGNAFDELLDPAEQAARFARDVAEREALYGPGWGVDRDFLAALAQGMPPTAGIAMGFDRLAMLAAGVPDLDGVRWLGGWPYEG